MVYTLLCAIMKDERPEHIHEWVNYHLAIGFDAILIYDNESSPPISQIMAPHPLVSVILAPGLKSQVGAYAHCLQKARENHWARWIGFLDADEFFCPMTCYDIREILEKYEQFGGLCANWATFGPNGYRQRPNIPQIYAYTKRMSANKQEVTSGNWGMHVKCIVNPSKVTKVINSHQFAFMHGCFCVDEHFTPLQGAYRQNITYDVLRVNHYWTRSLEDLCEKLKKPRADDGQYRKDDVEEVYKYFSEICNIEDYRIIEVWHNANKNDS